MATEKRLIDASPLIDECDEIISIEWNHKVAPVSWADAHETFKETLLDAPTVDAVEVVRCRDCKHQIERGYAQYRYKWCDILRRINGKGDDGFCNYGERKYDE